MESERRRAIDGLAHFRDLGRPFETHNSLSHSWELLPYPISPVKWFHYYTLLETIVRSNDRDTDIFICGTVMTPFPVVFYEQTRLEVYRMFIKTHPIAYFGFWEELGSDCYSCLRQPLRIKSSSRGFAFPLLSLIPFTMICVQSHEQQLF